MSTEFTGLNELTRVKFEKLVSKLETEAKLELYLEFSDTDLVSCAKWLRVSKRYFLSKKAFEIRFKVYKTMRLSDLIDYVTYVC